MTQVDELTAALAPLLEDEMKTAEDVAKELIAQGWMRKTVAEAKLDYRTPVEVLVRGDWVKGYVNSIGPGKLLDVVHERGNWSGYAKGSNIRLPQD